jgi:hypothetical protein
MVIYAANSAPLQEHRSGPAEPLPLGPSRVVWFCLQRFRRLQGVHARCRPAAWAASGGLQAVARLRPALVSSRCAAMPGCPCQRLPPWVVASRPCQRAGPALAASPQPRPASASQRRRTLQAPCCLPAGPRMAATAHCQAATLAFRKAAAAQGIGQAHLPTVTFGDRARLLSASGVQFQCFGSHIQAITCRGVNQAAAGGGPTWGPMAMAALPGSGGMTPAPGHPIGGSTPVSCTGERGVTERRRSTQHAALIVAIS